MDLPNNFPLTEEQITNIKERLDGVTAYAGMGVAGPMRDLKRVFRGMMWSLDRWQTWKAAQAGADNERTILRNYMIAAEAVLAGYAAGNWDGGTAATQLLQNMPQLPQ